MSQSLQQAVARQRAALYESLAHPMAAIATACAPCWSEPDALDSALESALGTLSYAKYLYGLDPHCRQISATISRDGPLPDQRGRDRGQRPYVQRARSGESFSLSDAYISRNARRPTLTAVQAVVDASGVPCGWLGADFDLRELPLTRALYTQSTDWVQLKGDPSIRSGLFTQERVESFMDRQIDAILDLMIELIAVHGVFHGKLHFSSSRATLWLLEDPYRYRLLDFEDLSDPAICLAYTRRPYPPEAAIAVGDIEAVFRMFRSLRFMDENIYLRSGSLNIFNGMVGLNFSCDGSHYMHWSEFLKKDMDFWIGSGSACLADAPAASSIDAPSP